MNAALLNAIAHSDTPVDNFKPATKRALGDYLTNDMVRFLVIVNTIFMIGYFMEWWN